MCLLGDISTFLNGLVPATSNRAIIRILRSPTSGTRKHNPVKVGTLQNTQVRFMLKPSFSRAPANKQLIVQPCKSHDITTTEAAICVKTNLVPRIPTISNNPQLLKAIAVTLPTILSRFSFLFIQFSSPAQDHSSLLLNIKYIFLSQLNSHLAYKTLWNLKTEMVITNLKRGL